MKYLYRHLPGTSAALLVFAVVGLVVPASFLHTHPDPARVATIRMSEFVAVLLVAGYGLSLVHSMWKHRAVLGTMWRNSIWEPGFDFQLRPCL